MCCVKTVDEIFKNNADHKRLCVGVQP